MIADCLLIIDMQNGVYNPIEHKESFLKNINSRINLYHDYDKPVIFIQHNDDILIEGKHEWNFVKNLNHNEHDIYIQKTFRNSFYHTNLKNVLDKLNINSLEIYGLQTEYCIDATIKMAHGLDYNVYMKKGLSTTVDNDYMSADQSVSYYESIWNNEFLKLF
ncbi:isochorismatase family protein [Apilactobacillus timberlakei]|uniref:isochorismatase family protein n=1 Tax=Apilactobacillus timberlakei TaxID=2008380 RepID=UPI00112C2DD0|nr:isochorismatase family protein [Apilactobacillus timberlakei]TPR23161.1 isochorismatase family protein [Apilactobacillus timberlakei]